jgi:hypothetical protein
MIRHELFLHLNQATSTTVGIAWEVAAAVKGVA